MSDSSSSLARPLRDSVAGEVEDPCVETSRAGIIRRVEEHRHRSPDAVIAYEVPAHHNRPASRGRIGTPQFECRAQVFPVYSPDPERLDVRSNVLAKHNTRSQIALLLKDHVSVGKPERIAHPRKNLTIDWSRYHDPLAVQSELRLHGRTRSKRRTADQHQCDCYQQADPEIPGAMT